MICRKGTFGEYKAEARRASQVTVNCSGKRVFSVQEHGGGNLQPFSVRMAVFLSSSALRPFPPSIHGYLHLVKFRSRINCRSGGSAHTLSPVWEVILTRWFHFSPIGKPNHQYVTRTHG